MRYITPDISGVESESCMSFMLSILLDMHDCLVTENVTGISNRCLELAI